MVLASQRAGGAMDAAVWHVSLLGGLTLSDGVQSLSRLPSRAVTALLARLALAPQRTHGREELIELLWPGVALDVGRNRLRQALSTLKSVLEPAGREPLQPVLHADRLGVQVVPGALSCDALRFEQHVRNGQAEAARALYRGELLPGFYDEWIEDERSRLAALLDRLPASPAPDANVPAAADAPRGDAVVMPAPPARVTLPNFLTRMFGAESPAAALRLQVLDNRFVTVLGPGGSGKTRLAVEVAHSLRARADWPLSVPAPGADASFDLIAFVSLAACHQRSQALDALVRALEIAAPGHDALPAVTRALGGRRVLLLLDNYEQLVDDAADVVATLLSSLPLLHVLVTSRRALDLDGERVMELAALPLPEADAAVDAVAANPAVALFVDRARAVRADFHLSGRNRDAIVALVRELEGMPLAIELAASRVRTLAPAEMLQRLRSTGLPRLELLSRGTTRADAPSRHASMQRTIEWSWRLLEGEQAGLLAALTVFEGGFTAENAVALVEGETQQAPWLLDALVAHSLVHRRTDAEVLRFGIYQPIRDYAMAQAGPGEAEGWRRRLRAWALQWVRGLPRTPPLPLMRTEMPNLVAAMHSAVHDGAPGDAIVLLLSMQRALEDLSLPAEGLDLACAAVERCEDVLLQARGRTLLGPLLFTAGRAEAGLGQVEQAVACGALDTLQRARALHALARVRWRSRRRALEVEPLLDEAEALLAQAPDDELHASLLALRAFVANAHHADLLRGEALHQQALQLWERLGNQHAIASGRYNLAVCSQNAGRNLECLARLDPVIASARELHDWRRLSQSLNVRGNACSGLRDWSQAIRDYQDCIRTAWTAMSSYDLAFGLWNLPRALLRRRQVELAVRLLAFATAFWRAGFGPIFDEDLRYLKRFERLSHRLLPPARYDALWHEGEALPLQQAVALALHADA